MPFESMHIADRILLNFFGFIENEKYEVHSGDLLQGVHESSCIHDNHVC